MFIMREIDMKQELRNLIVKEDDLHILEVIKSLLVKSGVGAILIKKLALEALKKPKKISKQGKFMRGKNSRESWLTNLVYEISLCLSILYGFLQSKISA